MLQFLSTGRGEAAAGPHAWQLDETYLAGVIAFGEPSQNQRTRLNFTFGQDTLAIVMPPSRQTVRQASARGGQPQAIYVDMFTLDEKGSGSIPSGAEVSQHGGQFQRATTPLTFMGEGKIFVRLGKDGEELSGSYRVALGPSNSGIFSAILPSTTQARHRTQVALLLKDGKIIGVKIIWWV
jgi:hypothetical protein